VSHLSPSLTHLFDSSSLYVDLWKVLTSKICGVDLGVGTKNACGLGGSNSVISSAYLLAIDAITLPEFSSLFVDVDGVVQFDIECSISA